MAATWTRNCGHVVSLDANLSDHSYLNASGVIVWPVAALALTRSIPEAEVETAEILDAMTAADLVRYRMDCVTRSEVTARHSQPSGALSCLPNGDSESFQCVHRLREF